MAYPLIPPKSQWVDENGDPMVGGYLYFYDPATDNLKNTYPTADDADAQTNPNSNPVVLNARGEAAIFLENGETYKVAMYDVGDTLLWTVDDIATPADPTADAVSITDAGGYYTASNVEDALQELGASTGAAIIGIADGGGYYSATDVEGALQALGASTGAGIVGITDSGGYFSSTDVEGALQELKLSSGFTGIGGGIYNSTQTLTGAGSALSLTANKAYAVRGAIHAMENGGGLKWQLDCSQVPSQAGGIMYTGIENSGTWDVRNFSSSIETIHSITATTNGQVFSIIFEGFFTSNASNGGTIQFKAAQVSSSGNSTLTYSGSYMEIKEI